MTQEFIILKVKQLRVLAREKYVIGWYKMRKAELVSVLTSLAAASPSTSSHRRPASPSPSPSPSIHHSVTPPSTSQNQRRPMPDLYPAHANLTAFKHWFTEVDYGNKNANKWIKYYITQRPSKDIIHIATKLSLVKDNKIIQKFLQTINYTRA